MEIEVFIVSNGKIEKRAMGGDVDDDENGQVLLRSGVSGLSLSALLDYNGLAALKSAQYFRRTRISYRLVVKCQVLQVMPAAPTPLYNCSKQEIIRTGGSKLLTTGMQEAEPGGGLGGRDRLHIL
ncbi:hypothetical protein RB195_008819 [Necator americanus]|uniref:Uncharacterized protein n=1 Tax=Necator americanus TaxID=51031 RepID=A0ABR1CRN9_NECAM